MIREVAAQDTETAIEAAESCGLFSPEEIPTLRAQLEKSLSGESGRGEFWLADFDDTGRARGVTFCVEEVLTDRVWNLLSIGMREDLQHDGIGSSLLRSVESRLLEKSQRMLVIETTNGPDFENTRSFYRKHDYSEEGAIRDSHADGAHKIAFRKLL